MGTNAAVARQHLITAAEALREASERLCDYVEATMGDGDTDAPLSETAPLSGAGNTADTGNTALRHTHMAPNADNPHASGADRPRRWWLVIDSDGNISVALNEQTAREWATLWSKADNIPHTVVPVVEARVTRETVERVAERMFSYFTVGQWSKVRDAERDWWLQFARAALSALGLTVEE